MVMLEILFVGALVTV